MDYAHNTGAQGKVTNLMATSFFTLLHNPNQKN